MIDPGTNPLSPLTHDLIYSAPNPYTALVVTGGTPTSTRQLLGKVTPDQLLTVPLANVPAACAMLAGLWLWHDGLSESHSIAQKSPAELESASGKTSLPVQPGQALEEMTPTLSFWHAIMHRREGDFSNSKYWYARCREHPVLKGIASHAGDILNPLPADKSLLRLTRNGWDPNALVDLVEEVYDRPGDPRHGVAVMLQKLEWRLLFDHCTRAAAGR